MEPDAVLWDSVVFELPILADADAFSLRVGASAPDSIAHDGDTWLVTVIFYPEAAHLALILRRAEAWLAETGLGGVWFHLDGRPYLLRRTPRAADEAA